MLVILWLLSLSLINVSQTSNDNYDLNGVKKDVTELEDLYKLANAAAGNREISQCKLKLERKDCTVNLTALTSPCPVLKVLKVIFTDVDVAKASGGFINIEESLVNIQIDYDKVGSACNANKGDVEINLNSTGKHIRLIDRTYLPLEVVLLQVKWPLKANLRAIDLEINGVFISDNLNGMSKMPNYEGVAIQMRKPKGLTIFELKTSRLQTIQVKYLLRDFQLSTDILTNNLGLETKAALSLKKLTFTGASLRGYIEPGVMFELQLTGHHTGSLAFTGAKKIFVTVQKYHAQFKPSVAIFGKFNINSRLDVEILKVASVSDIPMFTFMSVIKEYMLVAASKKFAVVNIKEAREASNDFLCAECKVRFFPGLNVVFNVPDILRFLKTSNSSPSKASKRGVTTHTNNHRSIKRNKITLHLAENERNKLEYFMSKMKRSKISSRENRTGKKLSHRKHSRWRRGTLLSQNDKNEKENGSLAEFDDSFMLDSFSPFQRAINSNESAVLNNTLSDGAGNLNGSYSDFTSNKSLELNTTLSSSDSQANVLNITNLNTEKSRPTLRTSLMDNIAFFSNLNNNDLASKGMQQPQRPQQSTTLIQTPTISSTVSSSVIPIESISPTMTNSTIRDSSILVSSTPVMSIAISNKSQTESMDTDTLSFHDISSLTSERQESDSKITVLMRSKVNSDDANVKVFCNIVEQYVKCSFPQTMEADLGDINRFVFKSLEGEGTCRPFNGTPEMFSINHILISDEHLQINLNTTKTNELVPNLMTINKYMGLSITVPKETNGKFNFKDASFSGYGKALLVDQQISVSLLQTSEDCLVSGQLHLSTIPNITKEFGTDLQSIIKTFPSLEKISFDSLTVTSSLNTGKYLQLSGKTQRFSNSPFELRTTIWEDMNRRKISLAIVGSNVRIDDMLQMIYGKNLIVQPWFIMQEAAFVISSHKITSLTFNNTLLKEASKEAGISFIGKLSRPTTCESYLAMDKFCQFFHSKLRITSGMLLKGNITKEKLFISGRTNGFFKISQEVKMVNPAVVIQYEQGRNDFYVSGMIEVNMRGSIFKFEGRISRHGSGFVILQDASPAVYNLFKNPFIQFKPLLAISQLSKRDDFACVFELHPSYIGISNGGNSSVLLVKNPTGKIFPSEPTENFFHGILQNLTMKKIFEAIGLEKSLRSVKSLFTDASFVGISKVIYSEAEKDERFYFINNPVPPGLTIYGQLAIGLNHMKTAVQFHGNLSVQVTINWPALNLVKGLIMIRKSKEDFSTGSQLIISASDNQTHPIKMKSFVSALGMERENIDVYLSKKKDGLLFEFMMKMKLFNEVDFIMAYRGYENSNPGFRVKGHCSGIHSLKPTARNHLRQIFNDFIILYTKEKKANFKATRDIDQLIHELGSSIEMNVKAKLKDLIIRLEDVEESIKVYQADIDMDCVEKCKKPVEVQTLQEQLIGDPELQNIRIQKITTKWAMNVSCIAFCEVGKGMSQKIAAEKLVQARNLYPLYEKQKQHALRLDGFLRVAQKIKDTAIKARAYFLKHSEKAKQVVDKFMRESVSVNWFELLDINIPEEEVSKLKEKLPCFRMVVKFTLFRVSKEMIEETCANGEFLDNIARHVFHTLFSKSEVTSLIQHFDKVKSFYARIRLRRNELVDFIRNDDIDDIEPSRIEELSKRDEVFKPLVKQLESKEGLYDKRFKKLILTQIPQYSVHSYKTAVVMNKKSPWAVLRSKRDLAIPLHKRTYRSLPVNLTGDCNTVNGVVRKYSHITNALRDIVEAYNMGRITFAETRDNLVDSLHALDSMITNEANRTYYTKGELKDMIYWSVRVWKGVEDWVQVSTHQFEEHNRNAITQFTNQLNTIFSSGHASTAASFVQKLSHIGTTAMKRMSVISSPIVKKAAPAQPDDLMQTVALAISEFLTSKDMTLDFATEKIPALRTAVNALEANVPPCEATTVQQQQSIHSVHQMQTLQQEQPVQPVQPVQVDAATIANDAGTTNVMPEPSAGTNIVTENSAASTIMTESSPASAMVTSNSGTITMGGNPQILTEPSATTGLNDPSQVPNDAVLGNDALHNQGESTATTVTIK